MIDREFIKLNTSIQTGSNSKTLQTDEHGNIEAAIELRLPDNLYENTSSRKISSVEMQTSKMRLSLEETPIAQLPLDSEKSTETQAVSSCQLDVYPYCLRDDDNFYPGLNPTEGLAFPYYKTHNVDITYKLYMYDPRYPRIDHVDDIHQSGHANTGNIEIGEPFASTEPKLNGGCDHLMNLCPHTNREEYSPKDKSLMIKHVGTIEQMLQDALESAITYASTESSTTLTRRFINISEDNLDQVTPKPDMSIYFDREVYFDTDYQTYRFYYWYSEISENTETCHLTRACKPTIHIDGQSLTIAYDSSVFGNCIPVLWNTAFIDTGDTPKQMTLDELRNSVWKQPPPKRIYRYNAHVAEDMTYFFTLPEELTCAPFNVIANESFANTFSFLPWIEINTNKVKNFGKYLVTASTYDVPQQKSIELWKTTGAQNERVTRQYAKHEYQHGSQRNMLSFSYGENFYFNTGRTSYYSQYWNKNVDAIVGDVELITDAGIVVNDLSGDFSPGYITNTEILETYRTNTAPSTTPVVINTSETEEINQSGNPSQQIIVYFNLDGNGWVKGINRQTSADSSWSSETTPWKQWIPSTPPDQHNITNIFNNVNQHYRYITAYDYYYFSNGMAELENTLIYSIETNGACAIYTGSVNKSTTYRKLDFSLSPPIQFIPNLDIVDDKFYMLDAVSAEIDVSQPSLITKQDALFTVTETTSYENGTDLLEGTLLLGVMPSSEHPDYPYDPATRKHYVVGTNTTWVYSFSVSGDYTEQTELPPYEDRLNQYTTPLNYTSPTADAAVGGLTIPNTEPYSESQTVSALPSYTNSYETNNTALEEGTTTIDSGDYVMDVRQDTLPFSRHTNYCNAKFTDSNNNTTWGILLTSGTFDTRTKNFAIIPSFAYTGIEKTFDQENNVTVFTLTWDSGTLSDINIYIGPIYCYPTTHTISYPYTTEREVTAIGETSSSYEGNVRLTYTWNNLPVVVMSPIQSIVLTLQGITVTQEFQPINIMQPTGSSLTSTIPIINNYYALATTLRDLHDELVISKEAFDNTPTYTLNTGSGQERTIRLCAKYITKDGTLHQIFIPANGVFSIQLTFGISFYTL